MGAASFSTLTPLTPGVPFDLTAAAGGSAWRTRRGYTRQDWFQNAFNERRYNGGEQLWETTFGTPQQSNFNYDPLPQNLIYSDGLINQGNSIHTLTAARAYSYAAGATNCGLEYASIVLDRKACVLHWRGRISSAGGWVVEAAAMDGSFATQTFTLPVTGVDNDGDFALFYRGSARSFEETETHSTVRLRIKKTNTSGGDAYVASKCVLIVSAKNPPPSGIWHLMR